jgi:hypothetical protein
MQGAGSGTGTSGGADSAGDRATRLKQLFGTEGPNAITTNPAKAAQEALARLKETGQLPEGLTKDDLNYYRQVLVNASTSGNPNEAVQSVRAQIVDLAEKLLNK